jgi:FdhE protein
MPRTTAGVRTGASARLAELERRRPEWRPWLRLLRDASGELDADGWVESLRQAVPALDTQVSPASLQPPLLHGQTLTIDVARGHRLLLRLISAVPALRGYRPTVDDSVELLAAALRQDVAAIHLMAQRNGADPDAMASVAELAALPLLQACGRLLADRASPDWRGGSCPICGSWPSLSERRGLDRTRRLRCGRCAGDWEVEWLCCVYCGEREHRQLGSLVDEGREDGPKVETCATCRGYVKSLATLQAIPPLELVLQDLETVELDLVALERGYHRPRGPGRPLDVRVAGRR